MRNVYKEAHGYPENNGVLETVHVRGGAPQSWVQGTPRHQVLSTEDVYYPRGARGVGGCLWAGPRQTGTRQQAGVFCRNRFYGASGRVCARVTW